MKTCVSFTGMDQLLRFMVRCHLRTARMLVASLVCIGMFASVSARTVNVFACV